MDEPKLLNEKRRCRWVNEKNPAYVHYHDKEWGRPHQNDDYLFEMLILEAFQAGLSWECVLNKRPAFREAFDGFECRKVASYTPEKIGQLMENHRLRHGLFLSPGSRGDRRS